MNEGEPVHFCTTDFLSCLFGSERAPLPGQGAAFFLSCLFGSERLLTIAIQLKAFLSCVFGSERIVGGSFGSGTVSELPIRQ